MRPRSPPPVLPSLRLALYQPDIAQNTGTILRLAACFGVAVDIIGPAGFDMSSPALTRAGLDYAEHAVVTRHTGWEAFLAANELETVADTATKDNVVVSATKSPARLVLFTTHGATRLPEFQFQPRDILLFGRESAGVPAHVHDRADARVRIPLLPGRRSLNLAVSVGIATAEALRQTAGFAV